MKKIKVVHIVPLLSPGGAERVAVHVVRGLDRDRYEPAVISFRGRVGCELDYLLDEAGIEIQYLSKQPGFDYHVYSRVYRALVGLQPDVIHTHLHVLRYALPSMLLLRGAACLHTVHNLAEREIEPGMRWVQRRAFSRGVVPVAVAEEVARSVQRLYRIRECHVIPNGIPTNEYAHPSVRRGEWRAREGFSEGDVLLVCVARFAPQKNHALLVEAFAKVAGSNSHAHLVLVGEGELRSDIEERTKALGISARVHFLGLRTDIPEILGAMDIFVLSSDYEGNPLSVMEAMAAGLPIVATSVGGMKDVTDNGKEGYLVPPGDVEALSAAIRLLMMDPESRQTMGRAASLRAQKSFDVSTMVRSYEEMYEDLVGQPLHSNTKREFQESTFSAQPTDTVR